MFCSRKIKTLCCLKVAAAFMSLFFFFSSFGTLFQIQSEFTGISGLLLAIIEFSIWWKILHPFLPGSFCRTRWLLEDSALNSPPKFLIFFFFFMSILLWNSCFQLWLKVSWIKCSAIIRKAVMVILKRSQPECRG